MNSSFATLLKSSGLRASRAAAKVLEEMSTRARPVSLPQLRKCPRLHDWNETTIYRCVLRLMEAGLVRRIMLNGRAAYFELAIGKRGSVYLVCDHCGELSQAEATLLLSAVERLREQTQWQDAYFEFSLHGVCPHCRENEPQSRRSKPSSPAS